ncbi:MAG: ArnT family glycosyltransferase, partial [Myxococcota bacterium]
MVRLNKPPIPYWGVLGSYAVFGTVNEFTARVPAALAAIASILLVAALGRSLYGPRAGLLAGAILATTQLFVAAGRRAESDVPMTLFVILAIYGFERGYRGGSARWKPVFFVAMGLGFMSKGVPGVVVPLLAALIFLLWEGRAREAVRFPFLAGLLLTALIIAPWYALILQKFPDAMEVFRFETLRRLGEEAPHAKGFHYYFYRVPLHSLPWFLLAPVVWKAIRGDGAARAASRLPLAWLLGGVGFLTLLETKQPHYLIPLLPAIAVLFGGGLDRALASARWPWLTGKNLALLASAIAVTIFAYVSLVEPRLGNDASPRRSCSGVRTRVGEAPLILYKFGDSACTFYLRRTAPLAMSEKQLGEMLRGTPDAYVLLRGRDAGAPALADHPVLWESRYFKRHLILLGPAKKIAIEPPSSAPEGGATGVFD